MRECSLSERECLVMAYEALNSAMQIVAGQIGAAQEPDQILERPLRADTMQGPRTSLKASEIIYAPWQVEFTLALIPNKERGKSKKLTWDAVETALDYGQFKGLGEWRNSNMYGQFEWMRVDA